jgi:hypothetical protein
VFQLPHRVDIASQCPLELYTSIIKIADYAVTNGQFQVHKFRLAIGQITQTVYLGWQNLICTDLKVVAMILDTVAFSSV